jgi:hypothetical protein
VTRGHRAESENTMTGPDHYKAAEKLLEQASSMLSTNVAPEERTELVIRQAVMAMQGAAHAVLALAAATGLSAHLPELAQLSAQGGWLRLSD